MSGVCSVGEARPQAKCSGTVARFIIGPGSDKDLREIFLCQLHAEKSTLGSILELAVPFNRVDDFATMKITPLRVTEQTKHLKVK